MCTALLQVELAVLIAALAALSGCSTDATPLPAAGADPSDPFFGLAADQPLAVEVVRRTHERPLDAAAQQLTLRWSNGELALELERHDALIAQSYRTFELDENGTLVAIEAARRPKFCHYRGRVLDDGGRVLLAATLCDAFGAERVSALLHGSGRLVELRRTSDDLRYELVEVAWPEYLDDLEFAPPPGGVREPGFAPQAIGPVGPNGELWIEVLAFNDALRRSSFSSVAAAEHSTLTVTNMLSGLYYGSSLDPPIRIGLTGQITFEMDPYSVTTTNGEVSASTFLSTFSNWAESATGLPAHDHRQLLSGRNFEGATVGIAYQAGICRGRRSSSIVQHNFSSPVVAGIGAHELGHSLGMRHDQDAGCSNQYIMSASVCVSCPAQPDDFSACSQESLDQLLASTSVTCLANPIVSTFNGPSCGNGIVESGEECDCAASDCAGRDSCCNGATCQLTAGASCSATDACCSANSCQPLTSVSVCRTAAGPCDLTETCNGGALCPADRYLANGTSCTDEATSAAKCYRGHCVSRESQCKAQEAAFPSLAPLVPCDSTACGTLLCKQAPSGSCFSFSAEFADGTPCGSGKQCSSDICVDSNQIDSPSQASAVPALGPLSRVLLALLMLGGASSARHRRSSKAAPARPASSAAAAL